MAASLTPIARLGDEDNCRTRLEASRIENREFELAEGFKELGNDHVESTKTWDWVSFTFRALRINSIVGHIITLTSHIDLTRGLDNSST